MTRTRTTFGDMPVVHRDKRSGLRYAIFYRERHGPHVCVFTSHFGGQTANISLRDLSVMAGALRDADLKRAKKWISAHLVELNHAWNLAKEGRPPGRIP